MNVKIQPTLLLIIDDHQPMIDTCLAFLEQKYQVQANQPDVHLINTDQQSIKIAQVRELKQLLSYHPYQADQTIVCLLWADLATSAAQHAMLKSLEEPPAHAQCILVTAHSEKLLPTVQSRCRAVKFDFSPSHPTAAESENSIDFPQIDDLLNASYSRVIDMAAEFKDRPQALLLVRDLLQQIHQHPNYPDPELVMAASSLLKTQQLLEQNIHVQLALESCFFTLLGPVLKQALKEPLIKKS